LVQGLLLISHFISCTYNACTVLIVAAGVSSTLEDFAADLADLRGQTELRSLDALPGFAIREEIPLVENSEVERSIKKGTASPRVHARREQLELSRQTCRKRQVHTCARMR